MSDNESSEQKGSPRASMMDRTERIQAAEGGRPWEAGVYSPEAPQADRAASGSPDSAWLSAWILAAMEEGVYKPCDYNC